MGYPVSSVRRRSTAAWIGAAIFLFTIVISVLFAVLVPLKAPAGPVFPASGKEAGQAPVLPDVPTAAAAMIPAVAALPRVSAARDWAGGFSIVTRNPAATKAGYAVLERGGTAADAAFTAAAVLSVAEGYFSHVLGGGGWTLYYDRLRNTTAALDSVGPTGSRAVLSRYLDPPSGENRTFGMHLANVPGAWDGWMLLLQRYGTLELPELLEPAIDLAERGYSADATMVHFITLERDRIASMPDSARIFLPGGKIPSVGARIKQPELAATFRLIVTAYLTARTGGRLQAFEAARDIVYRGTIAKRILAFSDSHGGTFIADDFASYRASFATPIETDYRGIRVVQCPPNSAGLTMLLALNILEGFDFAGMRADDPEAIHRVVEATKLANTDKWRYVAEPGSMRVLPEVLLSETYAEARRSSIQTDAALRWPIPGGLETFTYHTTTFQVVDGSGNGIAVTTSIGAQFLVAGDTGILMNQRVLNMETDPDNPNVIAPRKKVRHTANPYLAFRNGELWLLGGNTGFDTQPQGQIQQFLNVVEFGMTAQEAVSAPRYITHAFPDVNYPHTARNTLVLEPGFPLSTMQGLTRRGHEFGSSAIFGNANLTLIDPETHRISVGADRRGGNSGMTGGSR